MTEKSHLTESGIPGVGVVPFGIHLCHFYPSRQELLETLIPYFTAGVRNKELCIWVAAHLLSVSEIASELTKCPDLQAALETGRLRVVDVLDWYGNPATMDPEKVLQKWLLEEERALAEGYNGLRITGNTSFVPPENWGGLMDYETLIHQRLQGRRVVTCCSYSRLKCEPVGVLEVVQRHHAALDRADGRWQVFMRPS